MRLKKLTLQAFGPFRNKIVIDFENNNISKGLLLITGDTGAGKTTIFDAICFALYGQTSGETRTANSLRSDFASLEDETYVELEFYYKNVLYSVKRSPEYIRKKKNRNGEVKQAATSEFEINGRIITKVTDVTKEITNLLGLDYKQFRQIAMLSQGEFTKFLLASSEEKTNVFRKIFNTDFYELLQTKLKNEKNLVEEKLKNIKEQIEAEKNNLQSIINIFQLNNDEIVNTLDKKIQDDYSKLSQIKQLRDKANDEQIKIKSEIDKIQENNTNIKQFEETKKAYKQLLETNLDINDKKDIYDYNIKISAIINKQIILLKKEESQLKNYQQKLLENTEKLKSLQEIYNNNKQKYEKLNNYSSKVKEYHNNKDICIELEKNYQKYQELQKKLIENKQKLTKLIDECKIENDLYEKLRTDYYLNVSVELADLLEENKPCPVCGSVNHPSKANQKLSCVTKTELEIQENKFKEKDNLRKKIEITIQNISDNINELKIAKDLDVDNELIKIKNKITNIDIELTNLEQNYKLLSKEKEEITNKLSSLTENVNSYHENVDNINKNINEYNINLEKIYSDNNTSFEEYSIKTLEQNELNNLKNKIEEFNSKKSNLEGVIAILTEKVKNKKYEDIEEKKILYQEKVLEYQKLDEEYKNENTLLERLKISTKNIKDNILKENKIEVEYKIIKILSDTANGTLIGRQKISFENYVQAHYLNIVLIEANKRLIKMTDGRYQLKKKEIESKLNIKSGLEFSIFDAYTGKEREVSSLSGGEKFKTSLSLALGLSDVISMHTGGIKIDSLFIDEGFGSLDSDSLNQAINILDDLSNNEKLVGVISHVSELMSRINNKIVIKKNVNGSSLSITSS